VAAVSGALEIGRVGGTAHTVDVAWREGDNATVELDGRRYHGRLHSAGDADALVLEDRTERVWTYVTGDTVWVHAFGRAWELTVVDPVERSRTGGDSGDVALAPMPGTVVAVHVAPGDAVTAGQTLVVIESMKMQSEIAAERDGVVDRVLVAVADTFDRGASLVALAPQAEEE
jgi:biotin carboxyl carrier protein